MRHFPKAIQHLEAKNGTRRVIGSRGVQIILPSKGIDRPLFLQTYRNAMLVVTLLDGKGRDLGAIPIPTP